MAIVIKEAQVKDAAAIKALIHQLGYEIETGDVERNIDFYNKVKGHVLIAVEEENIIGFISGAYLPLFHATGQMLRITAMCVDQRQRSRGIGKLLVATLEERCRENNCFYLEVTSGAHRNKEAHLFYMNIGYRVYEGKRFLKNLEP